MTKEEKQLQKAIAELKVEFAIASERELVRNPVAYALYQVWKKYDKGGKQR